MALLQETAATIRISVRSIPERLGMSLATIVGISLVVLVLIGFLGMANGFRRTMEGTGSEQVLILLARGASHEVDSMISADQYRHLEEAPGIARGSGGGALISGEVYAVVSADKRDGGAVNLPFRGVGGRSLEVRSGFTLAEGRMFRPGTQEIVIGRALQRQAEGFDLGRTIDLGPGEWTIVGVVDAGGSALESEIWGDLRVVQSLFKLNNIYQTVRLRQTIPGGREELTRFVAADPQLNLEVKSEQEFYAGQSRGLSNMIRYIGWPLALLMAAGALAGALNTMHTSVAMRATEIATLRIIGFGGVSTFCGVMAEALLLSLAGAAVGVALGALFLHNMTASTLASGMTMLSFELKLSWSIVALAVGLALGVGMIGGAIAAWRAARQPVLQALAQ